MTTQTEGIPGELSSSVRTNALAQLVGCTDSKVERLHVGIDLMTCEWVGNFHFENDFYDPFRHRHNNAIIKQWMEKTDIHVTEAQLSPIDIYHFTRISKWIMIYTDPLNGCYGFFLFLGVSLGRFELDIAGTGHTQKTIDLFKTLDEATETPLCYLDEVVSHFTLPAPPGLKCLALLRLFRLTVEDNDITQETKKQRT